jgi:hypothetical protein
MLRCAWISSSVAWLSWCPFTCLKDQEMLELFLNE